MFGVGTTAPGADIEVLDWKTGIWSSSKATKYVLPHLFYIMIFASYNTLQCSFTGYHRGVYNNGNGMQVYFTFPDMLQLTGKLSLREKPRTLLD